MLKSTSLDVLKFFFIISSFLHLSLAVNAETTAKDIFEEKRSHVYQIRVIDIESGDKFSIGSGFQISEAGHVATNFHVVSSFVHEPEKYRLELVKEDESIEPIQLLNIDVIHDLAIVYSEILDKKYIPLGSHNLKNGERIYSMGNPHDLGMTIIEGTYNGFVQHVRHQQVLFSGSLNGGMSGGPALNAAGEVIGVNVSKGGEQISFLVPVEHLIVLLESTAKSKEDFIEKIRIDLLSDQDSFFKEITNGEITHEKLGDMNIPVDLADSLKCWGHTQDDEKRLYKGVHQHCRSEDHIYVSDSIYLGYFYYDYEWITTEALNPFQFYSAVENRFNHRGLNSTYDEEEITSFVCHTQRVDINQSQWKASTCMRSYIKYPDLYDASFVMVSLDSNEKALIVSAGATGISKKNALGLFKHIMEAVQWTH